MDAVRAGDTSRGDKGWTVGDLSQATGLSQRVLRHWEQLGLVAPARGRPMTPNCS